MAEASSKVEKVDQSIGNKDLRATSPGGNFEITIDVDSSIATERSAVKGKLGAFYEVCKKIY